MPLNSRTLFEKIDGQFVVTMRAQFDRFKSVLRSEGIKASLAYLNSLVPYQFTALFLFSRETLENRYLYDRHNPEAETLAELPVTSSYCVFVRDSRGLFVMADSLSDSRVNDHPKRLEIRSYCGVPLIDEEGNILGSLCHFDKKAVPVTPEIVELLEKASEMIASLVAAKVRLSSLG